MEDNMPPLQWPLVRIVTVNAGKDGAIRVVNVRTSAGECTRAIHRLAILPLDTQEVPEDVKENVRRLLRVCANTTQAVPIMAEPPVKVASFPDNTGTYVESSKRIALTSAEWRII